jgi:hypothetical protein
MKKSVFVLCLLLGLIAIVVLSWGWCSINDTSPAEKKSEDPFYFGIPEKPVYSKSVVDSPKSSYEFDPVLQFDLVRHDFIIRNTTDTMLELKKVEACCGSLVESYSRQIPAGKEGVIKTVLLTDRRGGEEIRGTIRAKTNDPEHPEWIIDISCFVKKFADISEHTIMLSGPWRTAIEGSSVVMPTADYPFQITSLKAKRGIFITYGYREITQEGKKGYLIWAKNTRQEPGVIRDTIYVQTDNPDRPQFLIRVQGKLTD